MTPEARASLEERIRIAHDAGRFDDAAATGLEGYGAEILSYLMAVAQDEDRAAETYSVFCEKLWRGLEKFSWRSSFRTWAYVVARSALASVSTDPYERRRQRLSTSEAHGVAHLERSGTRPFQKTEVKDRFAALRTSLTEADRELLVLRIDREMDWRDIAAVLAEPDATPAELKKKSASLRKRFERVKNRLRTMALDAGLLGETT